MAKEDKFQSRCVWREPSLITSSDLIQTEPPCLAELERIQVQGAAKINPGKKRTLKSRIHLIKETATRLSTLTLKG